MGQKGYQNLLQDGVGNSRFERRLKYTIALERELERTLSMIDGVEHVKLHIAMTEPKLLGSPDKRSVSAFIVDSNPTYRPHIDRSVRLIIGDAVANLDPEHIKVVYSTAHTPMTDNHFHLMQLSHVNDPHFQSKVTYESYYASKIKTLLQGLALDKISEVIVNVVLTDREVVSRESIPLQGGDDQGPVVIQSHITSEARESKPQSVTSKKQRYVTGSREVTTSQIPRLVKRVDVAIVIRNYIPKSAIESLTQLVRNSIGIDDQSLLGIKGRVDIMNIEQARWPDGLVKDSENQTIETSENTNQDPDPDLDIDPVSTLGILDISDIEYVTSSDEEY